MQACKLGIPGGEFGRYVLGRSRFCNFSFSSLVWEGGKNGKHVGVLHGLRSGEDRSDRCLVGGAMGSDG